MYDLTDEEWDALTCSICGGKPVTLLAGLGHAYCEAHGPDDDLDEL